MVSGKQSLSHEALVRRPGFWVSLRTEIIRRAKNWKDGRKVMRRMKRRYIWACLKLLRSMVSSIKEGKRFDLVADRGSTVNTHICFRAREKSTSKIPGRQRQQPAGYLTKLEFHFRLFMSAVWLV